MAAPEPARATDTLEDALQSVEGFSQLSGRAKLIVQQLASEQVANPLMIRRWLFDLDDQDLLSRKGCGIRTLHEINAWRRRARLIGDQPILTGEAGGFVVELIAEAKDLALNLERLGLMLRLAMWAIAPGELAGSEQRSTPRPPAQ